MADKIDESTPQGTESPTLGDDRIREFKVNVNALLEVEHDISDDATTSGFHGTQVTGKADTAISTPPTGYGRFGFKVISGVTELFYRDDTGQEIQITSAGKLLLTLNIIDNDAYLVATDNAGTGTVNMMKINTSDQILFGAVVAAYTMAGAIAMGDNKITGLANATATGDAVHLGQWSPTAFVGAEAMTIPNGFSLKTGTATIVASNATNAIAYAVDFPVATDKIWWSRTSYSAGGNRQYVDSDSKSGFNINNANDGGANFTIQWFAIGH